MEYYKIDSTTFPFPGYYGMKNGFGNIIPKGTHRNEIPLEAVPIFEKCKKFGHNQNESCSKNQIGWLDINAAPTVFPIITRYDARRAKYVLFNAKKPSFSMKQLVFNIVNSKKNMSKSKSEDEFHWAKKDAKKDIFNFWDIYG